MKKWLQRIVALFSGGLLLGFVALFYLLGTENGAQFLVAQAEKQLADQLRIGTVSGTVLERLELTDIQFTDPSGKVQVGTVVLDWQPSDVLHLNFHVHELLVADISYFAFPSPSELATDESTPLVLPEISLPLTLTLDLLRLENFVFVAAPGDDPVSVENALLTLSWDTRGIHVQNLIVEMQEGRLQGQGTLNPVGSYPLQFTTEVESTGADLPTLKLTGEYFGDLQELTVDQTVSGDIEAKLRGTLRQVLAALSWQGDLDILALSPAVFGSEIPGILTGTLHTQGDLKELDVTGALSMRDSAIKEVNWDVNLDIHTTLENMSVQVRQLLLSQQGTATQIAIQGTVDGEQNLDIALDWKELQWPVIGAAEYSSAQGKLHLQGPVNAYTLSLNADVAGTQMPIAHVQLDAEGSTEDLDISRLTIHTLDGVVGMQGQIGWLPQVTWQIRTDGKHINPGLQYHQWPGVLDWLLETRGKVTKQGVIADIGITRLKGTLRTLPVSGTGEIQITPEDIRVNDLNVSSGSAFISASGRLGNTSAVDWRIQVRDFADLLPGSSGTLMADGRILGKKNEPLVTARITADLLQLPWVEIGQLQSKVKLDLSWQDPFALQLAAKEIQVGENFIQQAIVNAEGTLERHSAVFSATNERVDLSFSLAGGWQQEQWQGMLNSCSLTVDELGFWQLDEPAKVVASSTTAELEELCLTRDDAANLCLKGLWDDKNVNTSGSLKLDGFLLSWLSPWFPEVLQRIDGVLSVQADATMKNGLKADVLAAITPGSIGYVTDSRKGVLPHEGAQMQLHIADDILNADMRLSVDSNTIKGTFTSIDLLQSPEAGTAKIEGELLVDAKKFDVIELFVPEVRELNAAVDARFKVRGTMNKPNIKGTGFLRIGHILIPVAGLELENTVFELAAESNTVTLRGKLNSPGGYLELNGKAVLAGASNNSVRLILQGKNFRLINLPDMRVYISSDLVLERRKDLFRLAGEVAIPKAEILLRELPKGTVTVSPDVVIVQKVTKDEPKSPFQMKLKLSLGEDVHFAGLGLNSYIDGQLIILAEPDEQVIGSGEFHIKQGTFRAYGQDLDIRTGIISFPGGPLSKPGINLKASRTIGEVVVGVNAIGLASKPRLTTFSTPPMSESSIISYLLTGSAPNDIGKGGMLSIGRQINNKLSVSVGADVKTGDSEFVTRYRVNRKIHIQATTATKNNAADIFYTTEFGGDENREDTTLEEPVDKHSNETR